MPKILWVCTRLISNVFSKCTLCLDAFVVVREKSWLLYSGLFSVPFPLGYMCYLLGIGFSECLQQKTRKIKYNRKVNVYFRWCSNVFLSSSPLPAISKLTFVGRYTLPSAWSSLSSSSYFLRIFALPVGFISRNEYFSTPECRGQITE